MYHCIGTNFIKKNNTGKFSHLNMYNSDGFTLKAIRRTDNSVHLSWVLHAFIYGNMLGHYSILRINNSACCHNKNCEPIASPQKLKTD